MMLCKVFLLATALGALFPTAATAQLVNLAAEDAARTASGERVRVLVWFQPPLPDEAALPADRESLMTRALDVARDDILTRTLGRSSDNLEAVPDGADAPRMLRRYRYAPAAAMLLSDEEIGALSNDPGVVSIETDALYAPMLNLTTQQVGADTMHDLGHTGAGRGVAILDTGVDHQHPMFEGRIIGSACFSTTRAGESTSFCPAGAQTDTVTPFAGDNCEELETNPSIGAFGCSHGTHVAGIATGSAYQRGAQPEITGVAPGAGIVAVQVFSRFTDPYLCGGAPACPLAYSGDILAALEWVYVRRADFNLAAVNMSLGGGRYREYCPANPLSDIIDMLRSDGVATVIAAGNDGYPDSVSAPACIEGAMAVLSRTRLSNNYAPHTNRGPLVDFAAPGEMVTSADTRNDNAGLPGTRPASGTSMAAPHVAGAFALLSASHPEASVSEIELALKATGTITPSNHGGGGTPFIRIPQAHQALSNHPGGALGDLQVSPLTPFEASGRVGDPDSFNSAEYRLENTGSAPIDWLVSSSAPWIRFNVAATPGTDAPASGMLAPGEAVYVRLSIEPGGLGAIFQRSFFDIYASSSETQLRIPVTLRMRRPSPRNDDFSDALQLSVLQPHVAATTDHATREDGEPVHAGVQGGASLWWRWTAPFSQRMRATVTSHDYDAIIAIYTGLQLTELTEIASDADAVFSGSTVSIVSFDAVQGEVYYFAVDSYLGEPGQGSLSLEVMDRPTNDQLATATEITGPFGIMRGHNFNAEPDAQGDHDHLDNSVWYRWVGANAGLAGIHIRGALARDTLRANIYRQLADGEGLTLISTTLSASRHDDYFATFEAEDGAVYIIQIGMESSSIRDEFLLSWWSGAQTGRRLRLALLPGARSIFRGRTATAFATVVNPANLGVTARNCRFEAPAGYYGALDFQTTDRATNIVTGEPNAPVDIPHGEQQSFVLGFTPIQTTGIPVQPTFQCDGLWSLASPGVSDIQINTREAPPADIIAIAITASGDGVARTQAGTTTAFAIAAINIGVAEEVTVRVDAPTMPVTARICETNPATGQCLTSRRSQVTSAFSPDQVRTYSVFITASPYADVPFDPAANRVRVDFLQGGSNLASTSIAFHTVE